MKNGKGFFGLGVVIVIALLIAAGAYYLGTQKTEAPANTGENNSKAEENTNETTTLKVFFHNKIKANDPDFIECGKVFSLEREVPKTTAVARAALNELFKGPSEGEKVEGYFSSLPSGMVLENIEIVNGVASIYLNKPFHQGGSCAVVATGAEYANTLKQFPTIKDIRIFVNSVDQTENNMNP